VKALAIIGGGAAGLAAACSAGRCVRESNADIKITLLEKMGRPGKKLLATGNGRCNLSNVNLSAEYYHGGWAECAGDIFKLFGYPETMGFFSAMGLVCKTDGCGRVYPYCEQAAAVLDALRFEALRRGVEVKTDFNAVMITKKGRFEIYADDGNTQAADAVIVSAGGKAHPHLGSDGSGYALLTGLGHSVVTPYPALCQLKAEGLKPLKGIRVNATVSCVLRNGETSVENGEILFTGYGVSGIPVLNISGQIDDGCEISLDLCPEMDLRELTERLLCRRTVFANDACERFFTGFLNRQLGCILLRRSGADIINDPSGQMADPVIYNLSKNIKRFNITVTGRNGFKEAQVTGGGAPRGEFEGFMSRFAPGLFAAGEILDIAGNCGGYNLQWAWSSGYLAGREAALRLTL